MTLTSKKKALAAVIGLCGVALVLDRTMLAPGDASGAPAAAPATPPLPRPPARVERAADAPAPLARSALAARFAALAADRDLDPANAPDVFRTPSSWQARPASTSAPAAGETPAEAFRRQHVLAAVMEQAGAGACIIDGRGVRIGQEIDGFKLIAVESRAAIFESAAGERVELTLPEPATSPGA